jgi:hypothetical protein
MPITVSGTAITFNDATQQTTAANPSSYTGARGQVFNTSGTFTIPTGVTTIKVTVVGGGGGGRGENGPCGNPTVGNAGAASSVASGNQSISSVTANGGGAASANAVGAGGNGSGGALNYSGRAGNFPSFGGGDSYGQGGNSPFGIIGGPAGTAVQWYTGLTPGATLAVTRGAGGNGAGGGVPGGAGGGGVVYIEW